MEILEVILRRWMKLFLATRMREHGEFDCFKVSGSGPIFTAMVPFNKLK